MKDVAIFTVSFRSPSGECTPKMEDAFAELSKSLEYEAKKIKEEFSGVEFEIAES